MKKCLLGMVVFCLMPVLAQVATVSFRFTDNGGRYEAIGTKGEKFVTSWSGCGSDSMYAYRDCAVLVGVGGQWTDFPCLTSEFVFLDWEQRAPEISVGQWVVFLNAQNQFLCVRLKEVYNRSCGADKDLIVFEYKVYSDCKEVAEIVLDHHEAARTKYEIVGKDSGSAEFCFVNNSGKFTVVGSHGEQFVTDWSECGNDTIYAYRDNVELIAAAPDLAQFPDSADGFLLLDWEERAPVIPEGGWVVFLNASGQFLCVHVQNIKVKSRGEDENLLTFDYRVYGSASHVAESIVAAHEGRASAYELIGKNEGRVSFCHSHNNGHFVIVGSNGQRFVTGWSNCGAHSVYAYRDYVSAVGFGGDWSDFPSSTQAFAALDWSFRASTVAEGESVVFANSNGAYLCARVVEVRDASRGAGEDCLVFDFKIYGADTNVAGLIDAVRPSGDGIVSIDISSDKTVCLPWGKDLDLTLIRLIKTIHKTGCPRQFDVSNLLVIPHMTDGSLDLAHAYVKPEIVAEILDPAKGAKIDIGAARAFIETAKTREGLTYEFYQAETLEGLLDSKPTETRLGDGASFKPAIFKTGGKSGFFTIKVGK